MPCVSFSQGEDGLILHIDMSDESVRKRLYALIDEIMADRSCVEELLKKYGSLISLVIPDMPRTFEELETAWASEKENRKMYWRDFLIRADITCSQKDDRLAVSGNAKLYFEWLFGIDLTFELTANNKAVDLLADLTLENHRDYYEKLPYRLEFHCSRDKMRGFLNTRDATYSLTGERKTGEDGLIHYSASLTGQYGWDDSMLYDLDVVFDPQDESLKVSLFETRNAGKTYESREKLAELEVYKRIAGWDVKLATYYGDYILHLTTGENYYRLKYEHKWVHFWNSEYLDAWLYYAPDSHEYKARLDTNLFGRYRTKEIYSLDLRENELTFDVISGNTKVVHAGLAYMPTANGFDVDVEFLDYYLLGYKPSVLHLRKEDNVCSANLIWSYWSESSGAADVKLVLGEKGDFRSLDMNAVIEDFLEPVSKQNFSLSYTPGTLLCSDGNHLYELSVAENNAQRLELQLTRDYRTQMACLILELNDQGSLVGILTVEGQEWIRVVIEPVEKQQTVVMTRDNAFVIDQALLKMLFSNLAGSFNF